MGVFSYVCFWHQNDIFITSFLVDFFVKREEVTNKEVGSENGELLLIVTESVFQQLSQFLTKNNGKEKGSLTKFNISHF